MPTQRERKNKIEFYVNDEEKAFILEKMKVAKIKNLSAYLRKAAIDEKIEIHDYSELKEINYNLAKRINETNSIYQSDMEDNKRKVNEVRHIPQND